MLHMTNKDKTAATWSDVKATLGNFDPTWTVGADLSAENAETLGVAGPEPNMRC